MNKLIFSLLASLFFMGAAHAAPAAVCETGFAIRVVPGNKAVCEKTQKVRDDVGPRKCALDGRRIATEASDGGDMCQGTATPINSLAVGPALDCKLTYGANAQNDIKRGAPDRCYKVVDRTVRGDIAVRNE